MSPIKTCETSSDACVRLANPSALTSAGNEGLFRAALLAGASLIALAALGAPDVARACVPSLQTISMPTAGPVLSNSGAITVTSSGTINGGPDGVDAPTCSISTLMNNGAIGGAAGGPSAAGGRGVFSGQPIMTLTNGGMITGGAGGIADAMGTAGGAGGTAILSGGNITTLTNNAMIIGGEGGASQMSAEPAAPAAWAFWPAAAQSAP